MRSDCSSLDGVLFLNRVVADEHPQVRGRLRDQLQRIAGVRGDERFVAGDDVAADGAFCFGNLQPGATARRR